MTDHTPGPWHYSVEEGEQIYFGSSKTGKQLQVIPFDGVTSFEKASSICWLFHDGTEDEANARLIAAAPDLLFCVEAILDELEAGDHDETIMRWHSILQDAIRKVQRKETTE